MALGVLPHEPVAGAWPTKWERLAQGFQGVQNCKRYFLFSSRAVPEATIDGQASGFIALDFTLQLG